MKIYVSYRGSDTPSQAGRLTDRLEAHFGTGSVLRDLDAISPGKDIRATLRTTVEKSDVLLVIIGTGWTKAVDDKGRRRLDQPDDFVRQEIELALSRQMRLVPVLVGGASMPKSSDLPPSLAALTSLNAAVLQDGPGYDNDIAHLIAYLERIVKSSSQRKTRKRVGDVDQGKSQDDIASSTASSQLEAVPLNLDRYALSYGSAGILNAALTRSGGALTTSAVLLEISEQGRQGQDPQWIGDFLRQEVAAHPASYQKLIVEYGRAGSSKEKAPRMTAGLAWSLERAEEMAVQTTRDRKICGRHLLAALIVEPPQPHTLGAQRRLAAIGIDVLLLRQRLYEWVRGYGDDDSAWRTVLVGISPAPRIRAGFAADDPLGPDFLDIEQDVLALATLVAARDTDPPLSIGLFGDWGSGKTFFMGKLRHAVAQLSKEARESGKMQREQPFYKRIIQIEFNAWHYVEGNLWASMVDHILDNLRISDEDPESMTETLQKHWITQLGFAEKAQTEANRKTEQAAAKVEAAETAVTNAKAAHDAKQGELQELSRKNAAREFKLSGALPTIKQALAPLGIEEIGDAVADLQSSLRQARSVVEHGSAVLTPLLHATDRKNRWRSLLIILVAAPLSAAVISWLLTLLGQDRIAQVSGLATSAAGLLVAGASWIRRQAQWMAQRAKAIEDAQHTYDAALTKELADTAEKIAKAEQELALARQDYTLAQQRAEQARREREAAVADLAAATTSGLLGRFIQDRAASSDYRKHLGVLAIVRQDFQQLSKLIEEDNWRLAPDAPIDQLSPRGLTKIANLEEEMQDSDKRINRIVLYIDDLDRCPPAKVVDVLQAVHLLLAFPLFVVVVAVDARWVSRSLETRYRELLHVDDAQAPIDFAKMFGVARSEDYLEKIFQIPLWLRAMDANSARKMAQGLLRGGTAIAQQQAPPSGRNTVSEPPSPAPQRPEHAGARTAVPIPSQADDAGTSGASTASAETPSPSPRASLAANLASLEVSDFERFAIDGLSPLLGRSPRALKRFVNLYRLIKAGLTSAEHNAFVNQDESGSGDYQAVLFLLAVDTGLPRVSRAVFDVLTALRLEPEATDIAGFLAKLDNQNVAGLSDWDTLYGWLTSRMEVLRKDPDAVRRLVTWVPRVSRYSFQAAHIEASRNLASTRTRAKKAAP
jgi:hypothetical protein